MIITALFGTFGCMLYLAPTWILILRHKPAKAASMLLINIVAGFMLWPGLVGYACWPHKD